MKLFFTFLASLLLTSGFSQNYNFKNAAYYDSLLQEKLISNDSSYLSLLNNKIDFLLKNEKDTIQIINTVFEQIKYLKKQKQLDKAIKSLIGYENLYQSNRYPKEEVKYYKSLSKLCRFNYNIDSALLFTNKAKHLMTINSISNEYFDVYKLRGVIATEMNELDSAVFYFNKAIDNSNFIENKNKVVDIYTNLTVVFFNNNDLELAKKYALKGLKLAKKLDYDIGKADNSLKLAQVYNLKIVTRDSVLTLLTNSKNIYKKYNDLAFLMETLAEISTYYYLEQNLKKAIDYRNKTLKIAVDLSNPIYTCHTKLLLSKYYFENKDIKSASSLLKEVDENFNEIIFTEDIQIIHLRTLSSVCFAKGDIDNGTLYLDSLAKIYTKRAEINKEAKVNELRIQYNEEKNTNDILELKLEKAEKERTIQKKNIQTIVLLVLLILVILIVIGIWIFLNRFKKQRNQIKELHKELHHRTKNNLAIISAFIKEAQKSADNDLVDISKIKELQTRVTSIYEVHNLLLKKEFTAQTNIKEYIETLIPTIQKSFTSEGIKILVSGTNNALFNNESIFPLGLIVNEFITNSIKHAFKEESENKTIEINLNQNKNTFSMVLKDSGVGFDIKQQSKKSYGLKLIKLMAAQINAKATFVEVPQGSELMVDITLK